MDMLIKEMCGIEEVVTMIRGKEVTVVGGGGRQKGGMRLRGDPFPDDCGFLSLLALVAPPVFSSQVSKSGPLQWRMQACGIPSCLLQDSIGFTIWSLLNYTFGLKIHFNLELLI